MPRRTMDQSYLIMKVATPLKKVMVAFPEIMLPSIQATTIKLLATGLGTCSMVDESKPK